MKRISLRPVLILFLAAMGVAISPVFAGEPQSPAVSDSASSGTSSSSEGRLTVTYFHGSIRCVTCRKLEAYATEVMDSSFASARKDSSIVYRVVNFDEESNEHFQKDYELYSQALILSYSVDGKEKAWKNLDKIWVMVGDKEKYLNYVKDEINAFLAEQKK